MNVVKVLVVGIPVCLALVSLILMAFTTGPWGFSVRNVVWFVLFVNSAVALWIFWGRRNRA